MQTARTAWLQQQGLRVIRFSNREIDTNIDGVLEEIAAQCAPPQSPPAGGICSRPSGGDMFSPRRRELEGGE